VFQERNLLSISKNIGKGVKKLREQAGMRQSDLAKACNVKQPNLSRIEKGHCIPRHGTLLRIAEALGTSVEAIDGEASRLAALNSWPMGQPNRKGASGHKINVMSIPVFDTTMSYTVEFDQEGRPLGVTNMVLQLPALEAPCFACRVCGDAMHSGQGEGFEAGDIVVFARQRPRDGDFAFVRAGGFAYFRQIFYEADEIRLVPLNRKHEEIRTPSSEIEQIWKLVQHLRFFE
jgi:transcriptional regulator with XRE-family HTH domain